MSKRRLRSIAQQVQGAQVLFIDYLHISIVKKNTYPDLEASVALMEWIRSLLATSFKSCTVLASGLWYDMLRGRSCFVFVADGLSNKLKRLLCVNQNWKLLFRQMIEGIIAVLLPLVSLLVLELLVNRSSRRLELNWRRRCYFRLRWKQF